MSTCDGSQLGLPREKSAIFDVIEVNVVNISQGVM